MTEVTERAVKLTEAEVAKCREAARLNAVQLVALAKSLTDADRDVLRSAFGGYALGALTDAIETSRAVVVERKRAETAEADRDNWKAMWLESEKVAVKAEAEVARLRGALARGSNVRGAVRLVKAALDVSKAWGVYMEDAAAGHNALGEAVMGLRAALGDSRGTKS